MICKLLRGWSWTGATYPHTSSQMRRIRNVYVFSLSNIISAAWLMWQSFIYSQPLFHLDSQLFWYLTGAGWPTYSYSWEKDLKHKCYCESVRIGFEGSLYSSEIIGGSTMTSGVVTYSYFISSETKAPPNCVRRCGEWSTRYTYSEQASCWNQGNLLLWVETCFLCWWSE